MKSLHPAFLAALLGLTPLFVTAQQPPGPRERGDREEHDEGPGRPGRGRMGMNPLLQALDTDRNGELSPAEIQAAATALKTLDTDGNGTLSAEELRPRFREGGPRGPGGPEGPRADHTAALERLMANDKNGDGKLGADELPERMKGLVARADIDKDGFATKEELLKALAAQGGGRGRDGERGERRPPGQTNPDAR